MNLYLLFLIIISLLEIKIFLKDFNPNYLSKETTSSIKGLFVLIVFYSHISGYVTFSQNSFLMNKLSLFLGQLMVTMFLFYSGYGVFVSLKKKGKEYLDNFPKNRILKTYLQFFIIVGLFLIVNLFLNKKVKIFNIFLSFLGWDSLGNSNWYIFIIILLYLFTYLSFKIFSKSYEKSVVSVWLFTLLFLIIIKNFRPTYWYDTILCYPLGLSFGYYQKRIEIFLKNNCRYLISLLILAILFCIFRIGAHQILFCYEIMALIFTLLIVLITMKVNVRSKVLKWFGDRLFTFYILQRLPMIILKSYSLSPYLYFILCFGITIVLVIIFDYLFKRIFASKKKCL